MEGLEVFFLIVAFVISPFGIGWSSRSIGGALKGFLTGLALVLTIFWGFLLANYFGVYLPGINAPELALFSSTLSLLSLSVGWRLFQWGNSLAAADEGLRRNIYEQIKDEIARPLNQLAQKIGELESSMKEMADSTNRHADFSALLGDKMDDKFSDLSNYLEKSQAVLGKMCDELSRNFTELKEFLRTFLKPEAENRPSPADSSEKPAFTPRRLTTEDGRRARLSGREWQERIADFIREHFLKNLPIELESDHEKGKPDFVLRHRHTGKLLTVGACRALTLWPHRSGKRCSQRTINKQGVLAESKFAEKHKIPLFIVVANQRTGTPWFYIIPRTELDTFERVTTPSWLAEDNPPQEEIAQNHQEFKKFLEGLV